MGSVQTFASSIGMGLSLFTITIILGWLNIKYNWNGNFLKWIVLPTLGFFIAFIVNSILQKISCGTIKPTQIAIGSTTILIAIYLFLLLSLLNFIKKPIQSILPLSYSSMYGGVFAISFYMFWAGMFGEAFASGLAQSCGKN